MASTVRVEIEHDRATGTLKTHIQGIAGPACEDIQRLLAQYLGDASSEELTPEYHQRVAQQAQAGR